MFKRLLINRNQGRGAASIVQSQIQQALIRILFCLAVLAYLYVFSPGIDLYRSYIMPLAGLYILGALATILAVRQRPVSSIRTLVNPFIDIAMVSFAMLVDGGHASGLYFLLLMIIFGNGLRWGNAILAYCQALSVIGLVSVSIVTLTQMEYEINHGLLLWQVAGLIIIPLYVYLIGESEERAGQQLRHSEETSFMLLDQGPVPVFTFDLDDHEMPRIHYANAAINRVFREDLTYLVGERPDILTILEDGHDMLDFCRRVMLTVSKEPQIVLVRGRNKQGELLQLMCCATRLRWRNRWLGACYIIDMTNIETMRTRLQDEYTQEYISTLVASMVHDFRNVLTKIMGVAEIMQMESDSEATRKKLDDILTAGESGSEMINRMVRLGHRGRNATAAPAGKTTRRMIENTVGLARMHLKRDTQLHCNTEDHLPPTSATPAEIESILLNLLQNSIQAISKSGLIEVAVWRDSRCVLARPGNPALGIRVSDNGCGIADDDREHIFEPFWSKCGDEGGPGLGLTMVRHTVDKYRGDIDVQSTPGRGTSITIHLPGNQLPSVENETATIPTETTAESAAGKTETSGQPPAGRRILLVDDAPEVLTIHEALLKRLQFDVDTAPDGQQALRLFEKSSPVYDLVITDFRMPKMNGLELATAIRSSKADVRILIITAYGEEEQLRKASAQGIRLLNKPVSLARLEQVVQEMMAG